MSRLCVEGIVTRYTNYKENDRIITIFTTENGRIDAKARACRKAQSPLLPACQPFVFAEFELFRSGEYWRIDRANVKESFYPIREDVLRFAVGSSMLQLIHEAVGEEKTEPKLFSLLYHCLSYLAYGTVDPNDLICVFLVKYLDLIGYRPSIVRCASCGRDIRSDEHLYYSPSLGGAACAVCGSGAFPVSKLTLEALRRMLLLSDEELQRVVLKDKMRLEMRRCLISHVETVLEYGPRALGFYNDFLLHIE